MITINEIELKLSLHGKYLSEVAMTKLIGEKMFTGRVPGHGYRPLCKVQRSNEHGDSYLWADTVTGHLYNEYLICLSNDLILDGVPVPTGKKVLKRKRDHGH